MLSPHDEYGPVWPISIAPWEVQICCLRSDDEETKKTADNLYKGLLSDGIEVIYDDRGVRPGEMFSDADLIGAPIRVITTSLVLKLSSIKNPPIIYVNICYNNTSQTAESILECSG